jgi:hypothetical protein
MIWIRDPQKKDIYDSDNSKDLQRPTRTIIHKKWGI